jgi:hypothetical protein
MVSGIFIEPTLVRVHCLGRGRNASQDADQGGMRKKRPNALGTRFCSLEPPILKGNHPKSLGCHPSLAQSEEGEEG